MQSTSGAPTTTELHHVFFTLSDRKAQCSKSVQHLLSLVVLEYLNLKNQLVALQTLSSVTTTMPSSLEGSSSTCTMK